MKINGYWVDPGEPNLIIQAIKEVKDSAVILASVNNRMVLVTIVVSHPDTE